MKKKGMKNVFFGLLNQGITIVFGLILPRMFIMSYGSEVNGLISSVNQIYVYVALLEAGIGTASLQALYKTIAENDRDATNGVMSATNKFYRRTGISYLIVVVVLSFVYPLIVKSNIPYTTVCLVILLNGLGGVVNYFFQGKYRILLRAEGKNYLLSNLSTVIYILTNFSKIVFIQLGFDIVVIQFSYFVFNLVQMLYITGYIKKNYKWINLNVPPNTDALSGKKSVFVHQVTNLVFSNTDIIILTVFSGLKTVSVYALYNSFFNMLKSVLYSFLDGIQFALGQTYNSDFNEFKLMQERFEACYMTLTFMLYTIMYILILPFVAIYTKGITDINYVDYIVPLLFAIVFLLQGARGPMQLVVEYAKHFKETRGQAIAEMTINLGVTLVSVYHMGIYGVLIGTIVALLYRANAIILYVNKNILQRNPLVTYKRWGWCAGIFLLVFLVNVKIPIVVKTFLDLILIAVPASMIVILVYLLGMFLFEKETFEWIIKKIKIQLQKKSV